MYRRGTYLLDVPTIELLVEELGVIIGALDLMLLKGSQVVIELDVTDKQLPYLCGKRRLKDGSAAGLMHE